MNGASVLGRLLPPFLADVIGPFNTLTPASFLSGLFCLVLWLPAGINHDTSTPSPSLSASLADVMRRTIALEGTTLPDKSGRLIIAFAAMYGFSSGAVIAVIPPCVARITEVERIGSNMGLLYTIVSFPCVPSPSSLPFLPFSSRLPLHCMPVVASY